MLYMLKSTTNDLPKLGLHPILTVAHPMTVYLKPVHFFQNSKCVGSHAAAFPSNFCLFFVTLLTKTHHLFYSAT